MKIKMFVFSMALIGLVATDPLRKGGNACQEAKISCLQNIVEKRMWLLGYKKYIVRKEGDKIIVNVNGLDQGGREKLESVLNVSIPCKVELGSFFIRPIKIKKEKPYNALILNEFPERFGPIMADGFFWFFCDSENNFMLDPFWGRAILGKTKKPELYMALFRRGSYLLLVDTKDKIFDKTDVDFWAGVQVLPSKRYGVMNVVFSIKKEKRGQVWARIREASSSGSYVAKIFWDRIFSFGKMKIMEKNLELKNLNVFIPKRLLDGSNALFVLNGVGRLPSGATIKVVTQ